MRPTPRIASQDYLINPVPAEARVFAANFWGSSLVGRASAYPHGKAQLLGGRAPRPAGPGPGLGGAPAAAGGNLLRGQSGPVGEATGPSADQPFRCGHRLARPLEKRRVGGPGPESSQAGL